MTTNDYGYNPNETNGLINGPEYHAAVDYADQYTLAQVAAEGGKITRVRILTEAVCGARLADISYIHATLPDGRIVPVQVGGNTNCTPLHMMKKAFIDWAKSEGVYAKGIGLLDNSTWSVMY